MATQKGGVAKTTTVASLGAAFAGAGLRVLLVDLDAQSCLTFSLGVDPETVTSSLYHVLVERLPASSAVVRTSEGMDLLPSSIEVADAELRVAEQPGKEYRLRTALEDVRPSYDVVLLDCSPSLGVLTLNALTAADEVIVPLQCEMLGHRGVGQLLDTIDDVRRLLNPPLEVRGLLPTMFDARTNHSRAVLADVRSSYGVPVLEPAIPKSVRFAEATACGVSILAHARRSRGAQAYLQVADSLRAAWEPARPS